MFLYKYRPIDYWTLRGLNERTIHFKCPSEYNDPFDSRINLSFPINSSDYYNTQTQLTKDVRLSCFSEIDTNILMWSHYANNHKGICLKFETKILLQGNDIEYITLNPDDYSYSESFLPENAIIISKVNYNNFMLPKYEDSKTLKPQLFSFFFSKSENWKYEQEWRIYAQIQKLKTDNPRYLDNQLKGIIFGLKCSNEDIKLVKKIVSDQNIQFYKAMAIEDEFNIKVVEEG